MAGELNFGSFRLEVRDDNVAVATFSRPPVNAVSLSVYEDIGRLADHVAGDERIRALVITAPMEARAWCGGADLHDFKGMTVEKRKERYKHINAQLPRLHFIDCPTIAAINGAAIGVGVILAGLCDLRVASEDARFSCPEIDYGLIAGSAGIFAMLRIPEPKVREMLYTGGAFTARDLASTGFFNYVTSREAVLQCALDLGAKIAAKSPQTMRARKRASLSLEGSQWIEAYLEAQELSSALVENPENQAAVSAALDRHGRGEGV